MTFPIILAHGVCRFDKIWGDSWKIDNINEKDNLHYFKGIRTMLKQNGFTVYPTEWWHFDQWLPFHLHSEILHMQQYRRHQCQKSCQHHQPPGTQKPGSGRSPKINRSAEK